MQVVILLSFVVAVHSRSRVTIPLGGYTPVDQFPLPCTRYLWKNAVGCGGGTVALECPESHPNIKINDAFFGWDESHASSCPSATHEERPECDTNDSMDPNLPNDLAGAAKTVVQGLCERKSSCSIPVQSPSPFPKTCRTDPGNYLKVWWQCCTASAFNGCRRKVIKRSYVRVTPDCMSAFPLYFATCEGGCSSSEILPTLMDYSGSRRCQCCRVRNRSYYTLSVHCSKPGGGYEGHHIFEDIENVEDCECRDCSPTRG